MLSSEPPHDIWPHAGNCDYRSASRSGSYDVVALDFASRGGFSNTCTARWLRWFDATGSWTVRTRRLKRDLPMLGRTCGSGAVTRKHGRQRMQNPGKTTSEHCGNWTSIRSKRCAELRSASLPRQEAVNRRTRLRRTAQCGGITSCCPARTSRPLTRLSCAFCLDAYRLSSNDKLRKRSSSARSQLYDDAASQSRAPSIAAGYSKLMVAGAVDFAEKWSIVRSA